MISSPLNLEGVAAYAKAAQTPSHSRILNLENMAQGTCRNPAQLEHPISPELINYSSLCQSHPTDRGSTVAEKCHTIIGQSHC